MEINEPLRPKIGQSSEYQSGKEHERHGNLEDALCTKNILESYPLSRDDGNRYRNARCRYAQRKEIDRKGHLIKPYTFAAQNARNKNPVQRTDNLYDNTGYSKNEGALEKGLPFARFFL